jgi:hypothetical protein
MRRIIVLLAAMAAMVVVYAGAALATPVSDVEPNDSMAQAQNINDSFSLDSDANITDSTTVPHATVNGTGNDTYDYYSFTVPQAGVSTTGVFDIDGAFPSFDSSLRLYDSNGNFIAENDDLGSPDAGSVSCDPGCGDEPYTVDSYLVYNFPHAGTYYIKVSWFNSYVVPYDLDAPVPGGASYKLHVSVPNHTNYDWAGFYSPVDNPDVLNKAKAGSAIPVKFSLGGDQGLDIFATGSPGSRQINCDSADAVDAIEETVTAGSSSLSYDATTDQYTYVWKTNKGWANTCRELVVKLDDGTEHLANFKFVK